MSDIAVDTALDQAAGDKIHRHADILTSQLQAMRASMYPPEAKKTLRPFLTHEVSKLTSIPESTLKLLSQEGRGPVPERQENNHRVYTLGQINELRALMASQRPSEALRFLPHRRQGEHLQIVAIANFKGGSAKTTTALHLSQYLALQGYRVLAVDLDPQASLSAMLGAQPELDIGPNETIYAAVRYDEDRVPLKQVIRETYFEGLHLIPGNLEVMEYEHETPRILAQRQSGAGGVFFERLREVLHQVDADYDVIILDTPPSLGFLTLGAIYAATGMIITVHPAMLDVASMGQFLLMMSDLTGEINKAGASLAQDFLHYLITRHDPIDRPQTGMVTLLRHLFGSDVLVPTAIASTAIEAAGLAKQSLYEVEPGAIRRETYRRARDAMDEVNAAITELITTSWGRP
ncbi:replication protein A (plasmid) [Afipia carboxidovorans OM5]|uniref:Replication protein A n=1 Tax=Afipia carboxidovorans (strain ATCC 49405 / DSM 1227 / KCTC 32145 / OM5) TaxID=504832 RepID=F8C0W6_AFIC5|nr:plasmid partitioning protein RepA [Afipia carboxidovorans]AEI04448.1 replication protein A [Afipia carboxidovorans OM4]AEI08076.1 replication protein A [Afipia carboxidovorans OM5]